MDENLIVRPSKKPIYVVGSIVTAILLFIVNVFYRNPSVIGIVCLLVIFSIDAFIIAVTLKNKIIIRNGNIYYKTLFYTKEMLHNDILSVKYDSGIMILKFRKKDKIINQKIILFIYRSDDVELFIKRMDEWNTKS